MFFLLFVKQIWATYRNPNLTTPKFHDVLFLSIKWMIIVLESFQSNTAEFKIIILCY